MSDKATELYRMVHTFQSKRVEPDFHPKVAPPEFILALAERIFAAHEIIGRRAERRIVTITETDYALE